MYLQLPKRVDRHASACKRYYNSTKQLLKKKNGYLSYCLEK